MNEYGWLQIIAIVIGGGGGITGIISILVFIAGRIDKAREQRAQELVTHLSNSADIKRIELEQSTIDNKTIVDQLWKMLDEEKSDVTRLKKEVETLQDSNLLSQKNALTIYVAIRKMRQQLDLVELLLNTETESDNILNEVREIKKQLDEVEKLLP